MFGKKKAKLIKEVNELKFVVNELRHHIKELEDMHAREVCAWNEHRCAPERRLSYNGRVLSASEEKRARSNPHPSIKTRVSTDKVQGITFEELAKFVIDGTPIVREEKKEVIYNTKVGADSISKSVKTDLGNISYEERS